MTNIEAMKFVSDALDIAAQRGVFGNLNTAAAVHEAFRTITDDLRTRDAAIKRLESEVIGWEYDVKALKEKNAEFQQQLTECREACIAGSREIK
jgi:hypothetical protein